MITIDNLTYRIEGRILFDDASVAVPAGSRTGLVGRNGSGKTTLFRLIRGEILPDAGDITVRKGARIGSVAQEAPATDESVLDTVLMADTERLALMREAETATDAHRIAEIHTRLADISAHTAEARASAILKGLGFDNHSQRQSCARLSGGWRMRVALGGLLYSEPDLLLLDEPTNYLDLEGALWLEKYLAAYPRTVLIISHDRHLLNQAVGSIVELDHTKLEFYRGGFDTFERTRRIRREQSNKTREKQLARIAHMQSYVDRFRYKESKARQAQARLKAIARLAPPEALFDDSVVPFSFPKPKRPASAPMLSLDDVSVGYDGTPVLTGLTARIDPEDRIAVVGVNGNGKSTFAKLIAGELEPMSGTLTRARKLEVAYLAQHQIDKLRADQTPLAQLAPLTPDDSEARRRALLANMGLPTSRMETRVGDLSGGEKARLLFGLISFVGPHLLILDEPTSHLDIDSRDSLVESLNDFEGAVILVSHDRHLIEATADQIWIAAGGTISEFEDDLDGYRRMVAGGRAGPAPKAVAAVDRTARVAAQPNRKAQRQATAVEREKMVDLRRTVRQAEAMMDRLHRDIGRIEERLADPALYEDSHDEAVSLATERARMEEGLSAVEAEWLAATQTLEGLERGPKR